MEHRAARRQNETADPEALRERLRYAKAADWPAEVLHETEGERIVLSRTGAGDRVPGIWLPGKGAAALIVDPAGSAAARNSPQARDLIRSGRPVLMIDAYQTGAAIAARASSGSGEDSHSDHFPLVYSKSDAADRVQDILTALAFLNRAGSSPTTLIPVGEAAIWAFFAAAVAPVHVSVSADAHDFAGEDQQFTRPLLRARNPARRRLAGGETAGRSGRHNGIAAPQSIGRCRCHSAAALSFKAPTSSGAVSVGILSLYS